jgi:uncharacterized protein YjeT (DUF2065 family)
VAWDELFRALALVCIIEGLMPLLLPDRWRRALQNLTDIDPNRIRIFGGALIVIGLVALQLLK